MKKNFHTAHTRTLRTRCAVLSALIIILAFTTAHSAQIAIYDFINRTPDSTLQSLCDSIGQVFYDYLSLKQTGVTRVPGPADTTAILKADDAIIYGYLDFRDSKLFLSSKIQLGFEKLGKELAYDINDDIERNVVAAIDALFSVYERKYFSNVQIFTIPDSAEITIDGRKAGLSPWESTMSHGRHRLSIAKKTYLPLIDSIYVSQSDNKFRFTLALENATSAGSVQYLVKTKRRYSLVFFGGALAFGGAALVSQFIHSAAYDSYSRPALTQSEYDRQFDRTHNSLIVRNITLGLSGACATTFVILLF